MLNLVNDTEISITAIKVSYLESKECLNHLYIREIYASKYCIFHIVLFQIKYKVNFYVTESNSRELSLIQAEFEFA